MMHARAALALLLAPLLAGLCTDQALAQARGAAPAQGQGQAQAQPGPQRLGAFGNWTAATHTEAGQKVCYAFTRASKSEGGGNRQNVILTVTHRAQGRDQVAARAGYAFPRNAEVEVAVGATELPFYTSGDNAFARDGRAAVAAFRGGRDAVAKGPGPGGRGGTTDTFSLAGFTAAYEAISKECPAGRR